MFDSSIGQQADRRGTRRETHKPSGLQTPVPGVRTALRTLLQFEQCAACIVRRRAARVSGRESVIGVQSLDSPHWSCSGAAVSCFMRLNATPARIAPPSLPRAQNRPKTCAPSRSVLAFAFSVPHQMSASTDQCPPSAAGHFCTRDLYRPRRGVACAPLGHAVEHKLAGTPPTNIGSPPLALDSIVPFAPDGATPRGARAWLCC